MNVAAMHHVRFLERGSLDANVRRPAFPHTWQEHGKVGADEIVPCLTGATIAIVNKTPFSAETLAQLPSLAMIAVAATGTDNIDIACCRERGIVVSNIRNYAVRTVPEHAFTLILALRRNLTAYCNDVAHGLWQRSPQFCLSGHSIGDLYGSTIGIVGEGALGQGVARIARGFGMRVLFADHAPPKAPDVEFTPFDEMLAASDIVSLHVPLTSHTRNLIGARELSMMKRDALLINTARGGLVDEQALVNALQQGVIGGAGFDVLTVEPPRQGNPLLELELPNFILTPHVAWASKGAMQLLADQLIDNVEGFVAGAPRNVVT